MRRPSGRSRVRLAGASSRENGQPCFLSCLDRIVCPVDRLVKNTLSSEGLVDFKAATDVLTQRITAEEIAAAAGVSVSSIARARLDPASSAYRSPPVGWRKVLATLAREKGVVFHQLAGELENDR